MAAWKRYVDDTNFYIKPDSVDPVLSFLNSFNSNISFMYEEKHNNQILFLDILIFRNNCKTQATVHPKSTHNDDYLQWDSFAPDTCERSRFKYYY